MKQPAKRNPMPCCHIPNPNNPTFPPSLQPDAERFARYVGGAPLNQIGNLDPPTVLTSALHLEMKLWNPTRFAWYVNDALRNSWGVMSNRTTAPQGQYPRFAQTDQSYAFGRIMLPDALFNCRFTQFDEWLLNQIDTLRTAGLGRAGIPIWRPNGRNKPPELGTRGLSQKLVNMSLKYELCWQVAGQWVDTRFLGYAQRRIANMYQFLCPLHAPIDRILLRAIVGLPLGEWLIKKKKLLRRSGDLRQSSDGQFRSWSKLDCLRTYYGLQLMLRRIAMETWPKGCACDGSASDAIKRCADWFEEAFGKCYSPNKVGPDWIKASCELPDEVIKQTLDEMRSMNCGDDSKKISGPSDIEPSPFAKAHPTSGTQTVVNNTGAQRKTQNPSSFLECPKCKLCTEIIEQHRNLPSGQVAQLPPLGGTVVVQHNKHRIECSTQEGWTWQYHVNNGSVRVDRFSNGKEGENRYGEFAKSKQAANNDFGNGITGNGTRSIFKSTTQGASEKPGQYPNIAKAAVEIMGQIFAL